MEPRQARRIAGLALVFGLAVDLLFNGIAPGLNVPITVAAALAAITLLRPADRPIEGLDSWIPVVTLVAAAAVALRTDPVVVLLCLCVAGLGTLAWALAVSVGGLTRRSVAALALLATSGGMVVGLGSTAVLSSAASDGAIRRAAGAGVRSLPVLRGLLIAVPIVALFTLLLGSADIAFQNLVEAAWNLPVDIEALVRHATIVALAAWLGAGGLFVAAVGLPWGLADLDGRSAEVDATGEAAALGMPAEPDERASAPSTGSPGTGSPATGSGWVQPGPPVARPAGTGGLLGVTETITVLVAVQVLFAAFVIVQVAYLFGGFATVTGFGITYSEYARAGFFQLVAVVAGAGMLLTIGASIAGSSPLFRPVATGLAGLTAVILASAALRLGLYQQAYGWTELRFYVAAAIAWLATCLAVAFVAVLARRLRWLGHGVAFAAIAVLLGVSAIGPQAFITQQNVARALDPSLVPPGGKDGLDVDYISTFGEGAVPILVDALPRLDETTRARLLPALLRQRAALEADPSIRPWPAWNQAREEARAALATLPR